MKKIKQCTTNSPCIHCGKPDWCYQLGELTVCKRGAEPADGWQVTSKTDAEGSAYYAPVSQKSIRPAQIRCWEYPARDGSPLIQVRREDYGDGRTARIRPRRWNGEKWVEGYEGHVDRADIPIYRLDEIKQAIASGQPVFVVEGEPCADALRSLGLTATTNIGGSKKWRESDTADLAGAKVVLCPDRDEPGLAHMEQIAQKFPDAQWLYAPPSDFFWEHLPKSKGLDVADWIQDGASREDILRAVGERRATSIKEKPNSALAELQAEEENACNKVFAAFLKIEEAWGHRLRFNELSLTVELDGKPLIVDSMRLELATQLNILVDRADADDIVLALAKKDSYHPVREYLDRVHARGPVDISIFDGIAARYFGCDKEIYDTYLRKWMVGAVARIYKPGCKFDNTLILQGEQGLQKSSFFHELANGWFNDDLGDHSSKDTKLVLHSAWITEWAELSVFDKRHMGEIKGFLTSREDKFRPPYGRRVKSHPRQCVIAGTTNQDEFLADPTGDRRYWVLPVQKIIPIQLVRAEIDRLWAAAVQLYHQGESWWLTREEEAASSLENQAYRTHDVWLDFIEEYVWSKDSVTTAEILERGLEIERGKITRRDQMRVADVLKRLGWCQVITGPSDARRRTWVKCSSMNQKSARIF
jgi:predicted P-loop ATPase